MKKVSKLVFKGVSAAVLALTLVGGGQGIVSAEVLGDNYPSYWKNAAPDTIVDSWTMWNRECTSFVAYRLSSTNGYSLPVGYGHANTWGSIARSRGVRVDKTPAVGSVAWFDSYVGVGTGAMGHVAWVANVNGDSVELEEYNYNAGQGSHRYYRRTVHKSQISGFIHFKDLAGGTNTTSSTSASSNTGQLASSGIYHFSQSTPVRSGLSQNSPEVARYSPGQTVVYDQTMEAEGYRWISYIGGSGQRRYVPVQKLEKSAQIVSSPVTPISTTPQSQTINVGDRVVFKGVYKVYNKLNGGVTNFDLADGEPESWNVIDPGPLVETNAAGHEAGDQILLPGNYFTIPGQYKVLKVDRPSNGIYVQIGNKGVWLSTKMATKV